MHGTNEFYTVEELRDRLSISTIVFWQYRPVGRSTLEELAHHGIPRIELLESPQQFDMANPHSMKLVEEDCRSCGIQVAAYHAHMVNFAELDTEQKRIARVNLCRQQIDTMQELGGVLWSSHAGVADSTLVRCYEDLARHVEGTSASVAVENFSDQGKWVEDRMAFLDQIDHPHVGLVLDIGHVRNSGGNNPMTASGGPTEIIRKCGNRLKHLHLHGFKDGRDHFPPLVEGDTIQWVELFRVLRAAGYEGFFNFEPSGEPTHSGALRATAQAPEHIVEMAANTPHTQT